MFIVDNCTISLITRTILGISAVCTEKRFWYFYKGKLWGFDAFYSLRWS